MSESTDIGPRGESSRAALPFRRAHGALVPRGSAAMPAQPEGCAGSVDRGGAAVAGVTAAALLATFVVTLLMPVYFFVGDLRLTPLRIFLLLTFVPLLLRLLMGRAGPLRLIDGLMALHCLWIFVVLVLTHGAARIPFAGVTVIEIYGGYLVGRTLVLNQADYRTLLRYLMAGVAVLLPFALYELFTDRQPLRDLAGMIGETFEKPPSGRRPRLGMIRAMAVFEHPILLGLFAAMVLGPVLYLWRDRLWRTVAAATAVIVLAFTALSSAPLLAVALQLGLTVWDRLSRARWKLLAILAVAAYAAVDIAANRTPVTLMIHYLTFEGATGWMRLNIWDAGVAAVRQQPIFGYGLGDFPRPAWLVPSVDNFWLVTALRYGLPGLGLLIAALVAGAVAVMRARDLSQSAREIRTGHMIMLVALCLALCTVHVWGATGIFVMTMIGASMWLAGPAAKAGTDDPAPPVGSAQRSPESAARLDAGLPLRRGGSEATPLRRGAGVQLPAGRGQSG